LALANARGADLVLANDPDVDRLAVAVRDGSDYRQLTGNELGVLLGHYLLTERPTRGPRAVVASIVSSALLGRIAADLGARYEETLTGFKWIAARAIALEREGYEFVFGYEEALGYCVGDVVYDKDGISAALLAAEVAAVLRERGETLLGALDAIAARWGVFTSAQVSLTRKGASGVEAIRAMMAGLRASPPTHLDGDPVVAVVDYLAGGQGLPSSDVIALELASGSRVIARPSGTEPKMKFYFDIRREVAGDVRAARSRAVASMDRLKAAFLAELERG
jgi:phosphomannomutase